MTITLASYEQDCRKCGARVVGAVTSLRSPGDWFDRDSPDLTVTDCVVFAGKNARRHVCKQKESSAR